MIFSKTRYVLRKFSQQFLSSAPSEEELPYPRARSRSILPIDCTPGKVFDLKKIYQDLNIRFFKEELQLTIGWFGRERSKSVRKAVLGSYHEEEKAIRIHRSLDRKAIPLFFMEYLVYHEMVHSVVPYEYSGSGRTIFHGTKFKEYERRFPLYEKAVAWEKANRYVLLKKTKS